MRMRAHSFSLVAVLALLVALSGLAAAAGAPVPPPKKEGIGESASVDPFYGEFTQTIPIQVPAYHGLEPKLELRYRSGSRNGFVGMGWSLAGASTIERASPGRGAPRYDASDIFLLDGRELIPCASGSTSPSCTACPPSGAACYSTKIENYARIAFNSASNSWTVTAKNGRSSTYSALYVITPGTFRWGLTSVTDTHNNMVTYNYWCDAGADCYLDNIQYNGTTVTLYREARPDPITFANGSDVGRMRYRLKTIDVKVVSP